MNLVSDAHPLIWYFTDDSRLSRVALQAFEDTIRREKR